MCEPTKDLSYYGYVYLTLDQKYNKIYIGHKTGLIENSVNYYGSGKIIRRILKSRGIFFLKKRILGICFSRKELLNSETECKIFFNSMNPLYGYNLKLEDEGSWGREFTEEHKKNLSRGQKGRLVWNKGLTKETDCRLKKLSEERKGITLSESHRKNISKSNTGKSKNTKGKPGWNRGLTKETDERIRKRAESFKGHICSEETRQKLREKSKLHKHSNETKKLLSEQRKNRKLSEETKRKISLSLKGKKHAESAKLKISRANKGKPNKLKGKTFDEFFGLERSIEIKNKIKESKAKKRSTND